MLGASNEQVKVLGLGSDEIFEFSCCFHCWFFSWKSNAGHWRIWQNASLQHWGLPAIAGLHSYIYSYRHIQSLAQLSNLPIAWRLRPFPVRCWNQVCLDRPRWTQRTSACFGLPSGYLLHSHGTFVDDFGWFIGEYGDFPCFFPVRKFLNNQMGMSDYAECALRFPEAAIRWTSSWVWVCLGLLLLCRLTRVRFVPPLELWKPRWDFPCDCQWLQNVTMYRAWFKDLLARTL